VLQLERYLAESCGAQNDKTRQYAQLHAICTVPVFATLFVAVRIFVRIKLDIGLGADDLMMLAALCAYLTCIGTALGIALQGFGQHSFWLSTHEITRALMVCAASVLYL
jgi:hypothetical protein